MELETFLRVLINKWRIFVPVFGVTFLATLYFTLTQPPIYEAKATYVAKLSPTITDNRDFAAVINILSSRIEISTTYAEVANSRRLKTLAGKKLNLSPEILNNMSVNSRLIPGTNIIEVAVEGTNPSQVRDLVNAIGASTIEYVQGLYETFALAPLDEARTPQSPIRPKIALNLVLGGVLGLVLGVGIALLTYFFQTTYKPANKPPATETILEPEKVDDLSIQDLRQDLLAVYKQLASTRRALSRIQAALRKTNSYAHDIRSAVYDLEKYSNGNHAVGEEVEGGKKSLHSFHTDSQNEELYRG